MSVMVMVKCLCFCRFSSWSSFVHVLSGEETNVASIPVVMAAGALSGVVVASFITPLELIKCRYREHFHHHIVLHHAFISNSPLADSPSP